MLGKSKNFFLSLYKNKKKTILIVFFFVLLLFVLFSHPSLAQQDLEIDYPELFGEKPETAQTPLPNYVRYLFNFAVAIIGILALVTITWGGLLYFFSTGDIEKTKEGKERIKSAGWGLVILILSYLILTTINPQLVILDIPGLTPIIPEEYSYDPIQIKQASLIMEELPIARSAESGIWEEERTKRIEDLNLELEEFLKQEIEIDDSNLENEEINLISNLNKYLKTVTDECRCENLEAMCTKPQNGAIPIGCSGDPCQTDQEGGIEPDSARQRIIDSLEIDRDKIKIILEYQEKFKKEKELLREDLRQFQEIQAEIISCQSNNKELILLNDHLNTKQIFEKQGDQVAVIKSYLESRGNPLTFYCTVGGTIFDTASSSAYEIDYGAEPEGIEGTGAYETTKVQCPVELPTGKTLDNLRDLTVLAVFKLERMSLLLADMADQVQKMTELVSECNEDNCDISCNCIPNPCFMCCIPIPCGPCVPFCKSPCLQAVGICHGEACPVAEIEEKIKQIKKTEKKIFNTIEEIKLIFPQVSYNLDDVKNPYNLKNLSTAVGVCYSSDIYNPTWFLSNCENSIGNYGPTGHQIADCHPRNLYCCSASQEALSNPILPLQTDVSPIYIPPLKEFPLLGVGEDNCPLGWLCSDNVKRYNQYNDASEPLKQLISCIRTRLDRIEQREELLETIGLISSISDEKLYQGTCDWDISPKDPAGCSHNYELNRIKPRISAHYGGLICRNYEQSYAFDLDMSSDFQKAYVDEIIAAAKECSSEAFILDETSHIHIDIGEANNCGTSDF